MRSINNSTDTQQSLHACIAAYGFCFSCLFQQNHNITSVGMGRFTKFQGVHKLIKTMTIAKPY